MYGLPVGAVVVINVRRDKRRHSRPGAAGIVDNPRRRNGEPGGNAKHIKEI